LALLASAMALPVAAQGEGDEVRYVIQAGDTLTTIALRFGVSVDVLVGTNELENPNDIFVGQLIILPGVDWVSGTLAAQPVPLGETFRSLARRYALDSGTMARLGGLASPEQLFVGYPMLLPTGTGERLDGARAAVSAGGTLLEMAALSGTSPWALAAANQLPGTYATVPGDVLFTGEDGTGPGALPSPISQLQVTPGQITQGKTHVFAVSASGIALELTGSLNGEALHFFPGENGVYTALQGLHAMTPPGLYPLVIGGTLSNGAGFEVAQMVYVNEAGYGSESLSVDENTLETEVSEAESAFVQSLVQPVSMEKLWTGYFQAPSPFPDVINSSFGTRRSFNNSGFIYYHAGTDFGGGTGVETFAPAAGRVVFAGQLEVRGNATIIDHGWGVYTGYWHQSEIFVAEGDSVSVGQVIGLVGNTGRSTGAHLHWEFWVGGVQVEPMDWLAFVYP
jgi:murein DD-endopeptidase MepM/ murein hydrolase activator NlpD